MIVEALAVQIFEKFGGIRPMATKLGVPPSTVKSWHAKKSIPDWRKASIVAVARKHGIKIANTDFEQAVCSVSGCTRRADDPAAGCCDVRDCPFAVKEAA